MKKQIALITGSTSGIGQATARLFAENNIELICCGRREDRLEELKGELSGKTGVITLSFDVRDKEAVKKSLESLQASWRKIDILVNNAGNAHGLSFIQEGDLNDWDAMIDINIKGLLYVSRVIIPGMIERKSGHIVNIGSVAGQEVYPRGNVYCASKFAVDAINRGMRIDLNEHGIKVTAINPGLVETEFARVRFKGDEEKASGVYQGYKPLTPEDIADCILFAVTRPAHVVIADMLVFPKDQASSTIVNRKS
jgi:NADP-dependent 3-hydroxy acid dehydrogenase YdfG